MSTTFGALVRSFQSDLQYFNREVLSSESVAANSTFQVQALKDAAHFLRHNILTQDMGKEIAMTVLTGTVSSVLGRYAFSGILAMGASRFTSHLVSGLVMAGVSQLIEQQQVDRRIASTALSFKGSEIAGTAIENTLKFLPFPLRFLAGRVLGGALMSTMNVLQIGLENSLGWSNVNLEEQLSGHQLIHNIFMDTGVHLGNRVVHQGLNQVSIAKLGNGLRTLFERSQDAAAGLGLGVGGIGVFRRAKSLPKREALGIHLADSSNSSTLLRLYEGLDIPVPAGEGELPRLRVEKNDKGKSVIVGDQKGRKLPYDEAVGRTEASRMVAENRIELGNQLHRRVLEESLRFRLPDQRVVPLSEAMKAASSEGFRVIETPEPIQRGSIELNLTFEGRVYEGPEGFRQLAERLSTSDIATPEFADKLSHLADVAERNGGRISLEGRTVLVNGAMAEMLNVRDLLRAGANVIAVDYATAKIRALMEEAPHLGGKVYNIETPNMGPLSLLEHAPQVAALVNELAARLNTQVEVLNLAHKEYAELPLMGAMMAVTESIHEQGHLASVGYLLSTSMVAEIPQEMYDQARQNYANRPSWTRKLVESVFSIAGRFFGRRIYSPQGPGYLAEQMAKVWNIERWLLEERITVSANTMPMTGTASLLCGPKAGTRRIMRAGLFGAKDIGIHVSDVEATNGLAFYAWAHDLLNVGHVGHANMRISDTPQQLIQGVLSSQAHGRVDTNPQGCNVNSVSRPAGIRYISRWGNIFNNVASVLGMSGMPYSFIRSASEIVGAGTWVLPTQRDLLWPILRSRLRGFRGVEIPELTSDDRLIARSDSEGKIEGLSIRREGQDTPIQW